jgi:hypothetical protein
MYFRKGLEGMDLESRWTIDQYTPAFDKKLESYLAAFKKFYQEAYNKAVAAREHLIFKIEKEGKGVTLNSVKNRYYNESLADIVKNVSVKDRIIEFNGRLYQQINPVFLDPKPQGILDYRTHFFAPHKNLFGMLVDTYWFNILVVWIMTAILYITLYFELLRKLVESFGNVPGKVALPKVNFDKNK